MKRRFEILCYVISLYLNKLEKGFLRKKTWLRLHVAMMRLHPEKKFYL